MYCMVDSVIDIDSGDQPNMNFSAMPITVACYSSTTCLQVMDQQIPVSEGERAATPQSLQRITVAHLHPFPVGTVLERPVLHSLK